MADPEVGLPPTPPPHHLGDVYAAHSYFDKADSPALSNSDHASVAEQDIEKTVVQSWEKQGNLNRHSPIEYLYLTFDTPLPVPAYLRLPDGEDTPIPTPPDLKQYVDPMAWNPSRKRFIIILSCIATVFTAFTAGAYSPGAVQMSAEWHVSTLAVLVGISTFTTGFAIAPMVLAPFSEVNGRRPVFIATGILFVVCQLCCAVTRSYGGMLAARFFVGVGGSTFSTMVGGVVSDIYASKDRNTPMALFSGAAIFGTGLGPLVCSFIAQNISWRWMFWLQTIVDGVLIVFVTLFFKETRGSVLLSRKAKALNKWYTALEDAGHVGLITTTNVGSSVSDNTPKRIRWLVAADEERESITKLITLSLYRPFRLLFTEPILFSFSLWLSFSWAILYMTLAAVPLIFSRNYGFNIQESGAVFSAISVAGILFTFISIYQEKFARKGNLIKPDKWNLPESRLYFACIESPLVPIGLFMFGWTAAAGASVHWIVPTIAIAIANGGIFVIYLSTFNYLADSYGAYASSALAAQSFCRNILGGAFPLVTDALFLNLGFGPAGSLLGAIGIALSVVPWVLAIWGEKIRAKSKFATKQIAKSAQSTT